MPKLKSLIIILLVAVVVAGAAVLAVGTGKAKSAQTGYCAVLPDSIGLYAGNAVTQMGVQVGSISSITPGDDGVTVSFDVDSDRRLPANIQVVTRSKSVLADRSLELVGNYSRGPKLVAGTCVSKDRAHTPQSISQITGSIADLVDQLAPAGDTKSIEGSINAMSVALDGTGPQIATLMQTASRAARSPDQTIADIGSIITSTAPLTADALAKWQSISSIITKLPTATDMAAKVLWPGTVHMIYGMQPVLLAISDFHLKYGEYFYPTLDVLADALHIAATHVGEVKSALNSIPALASSASLVAAKGRGVGLRIRPPQVRIRTAQGAIFCRQINAFRSGSCSVEKGQTHLVRVGILDLLVAGVVR